MVLGLGYLAARWAELGRGWRIALILGAAFDFFLGIVLHFAVQCYALDRWLTPDRPPEAILRSYAESSLMNALAKMVHHLGFFRDVFSQPALLGLALLAVILTLAVFRAGRRPG